MSRLSPRTEIQRLALFGAIFSMLATVALAIYPNAGWVGAGVGLGLWLAAGWLWLNDPDNPHVMLP